MPKRKANNMKCYNVPHYQDGTECVTDLIDKQSELLIFESILTTFKLSIIHRGRWDSIENWLEPKTEPPSGNLASPNM